MARADGARGSEDHMRVQLRRQASGFAAGFAARTPVDAVFSGLEFLVMAMLAVQIARLGWTIVTPVTPLGNRVPARATAAGPIDPAVLGAFDPFFRARAEAGVAAVSSLGLNLLGTRVDTVSGRGSAIIATPDGKQSSYLVGETIVPGVTLAEVAFDAVTLDRGGAREQLFLDQSAGAAPVTPESAGIDAGGSGAGNAGTPAAPPRLAADIQITPRLKGSEVTGFVLAPKGSGAAFAAAGLMPGDVLVSVDGAPVATIGDPASLARRLDAGGAGIGIERGGKAMTLRIGGSR